MNNLKEFIVGHKKEVLTGLGFVGAVIGGILIGEHNVLKRLNVKPDTMYHVIHCTGEVDYRVKDIGFVCENLLKKLDNTDNKLADVFVFFEK